jgi:hypothetical protein
VHCPALGTQFLENTGAIFYSGREKGVVIYLLPDNEIYLVHPWLGQLVLSLDYCQKEEEEEEEACVTKAC